MNDINVGALSEAINDKMDRDAHNVESPSAVVVETYDDGNGNGYRIWSDNYCEQYGTINLSTVTDASNYTETYLKPFTDNNYTLTWCFGSTRATASYDKENYPNSKTSTGFTMWARSTSATAGVFVGWKAEGYIS